MALPEGIPAGSIGTLSYKPPFEKQLIPQTLEFILGQLPHWRDDPNRPADLSETHLNSSLCDFLDNCSRTDFPMVRFKHEEPQAKVHAVDLGVHGTEEITTVGTRSYTIYQPFLVVEAKRLPAPSQDREKEYVIGADKATGGIQRFRLGLHGADVETAVMIGYVEAESLGYWHKTINEWIVGLGSTASNGGCVWTGADVLGALAMDDELRTSSSVSHHQRPANCHSSTIMVRHMWVIMSRRPVTQSKSQRVP